MSFTIRVGTYDIVWMFNITNPDTTIANLTGYSANIVVWQNANTSIFTHSATVTNVSMGIVSYTLQPGDFTSPGVYYGSIQLSASGVGPEFTQEFSVGVTN